MDEAPHYEEYQYYAEYYYSRGGREEWIDGCVEWEPGGALCGVAVYYGAVDLLYL